MAGKLENYRQIVQRTLSQYAELTEQKTNPLKNVYVVCDEERDHYMLNILGWRDKHRIWNTLAYIRIEDEKCWIEVDGIEKGIATDLLDAGIPEEDIVLAFYHPSMRQFTEFATA